MTKPADARKMEEGHTRCHTIRSLDSIPEVPGIQRGPHHHPTEHLYQQRARVKQLPQHTRTHTAKLPLAPIKSPSPSRSFNSRPQAQTKTSDNTLTLRGKAALQFIPAKPVRRTCAKCQHLVHDADNIHSTLAYSRCRCHRLFQFQLQQYQMKINRKKPDSILRTSGPRNLPVGENSPHISSQQRGLNSKLLHAPRELPPILTSLDTSRQDITPDAGKGYKNLLSPHTSTISLQLSPRSSVSKLPTLGSPSLVYKDVSSASATKLHGVHMRSPSAAWQINSLQSTQQSVSHSHLQKPKSIRQLVDLIHYIPKSKQQTLKNTFRMLDKDEDGHLSIAEFLRGLPQGRPNTSVQNVLKQLYLETSKLTYFGRREFVVCYCAAEILFDSIIVTHCSVEVDGRFLNDVLIPYISTLSDQAIDGQVSIMAMKDTIIKLNSDHCFPFSVSIIATKLAKILQNNSLPLLDCMALAPYYLYVHSKP